MEFSREKMREIANATNKIKRLDSFTEKLEKEIEERALNGCFYYRTCTNGVRNIEEVIDYLESKGFDVEVKEGAIGNLMWIYW
jgi:hypothetical protein